MDGMGSSFFGQLDTSKASIESHLIIKNNPPNLIIMKNKILVNIEGEMIETRDPQLIGLAVLDSLEKNN